MDLETAIRRRHMVRNFAPTPLDPAVVKQLLDLARRGPSAGNTQAIEFLVLSSPAEVDRYWNTTLPGPKRDRFRWQGLLRAPVLILLTTRPAAYVDRYSEPDKARAGLGESVDAWPQPFWWIDAGAVAQNLLLLATRHGLGACLFGLFDNEESVKTTFAVPEDRRLVCTIALGLPETGQPALGLPETGQAGRSANRERPPLGSVTHYGRWTSDAQ